MTEPKHDGKRETKRDIKSLSATELQTALQEMGEAPFRAAQLVRALYGEQASGQIGVSGFEEMTTLGKALRQKLDERFYIDRITPANPKNSGELEVNQTLKFLFRLHDGHEIETVLIPDTGRGRDRLTVCVSTQVGCALACTFCATGYMGFTRNLTVGEIIDQVSHLQTWVKKAFGKRITNVVFMGMGEPMLNFERSVEAIDILASEDYAFHIGQSHLTLSTSGIATGIRKMGEMNAKFRLALSLHSAIEEKRKRVMPITNEVSLSDLRSALKFYYDRTGQDFTIEYLLLSGINDGAEDADALIRFSRTAPCKINLIDYNPIVNIDLHRTPEAHRDIFIRRLLAAGLTITVRRSRGQDISAACGQLATESTSSKKINTHRSSALQPRRKPQNL